MRADQAAGGAGERSERRGGVASKASGVGGCGERSERRGCVGRAKRAVGGPLAGLA